MSTSDGLPTAGTRRLITISVMSASLMISLDTTIANVALPHIQGSVSASQDEISWMLTSYIVAQAIVTPLTGWLAAQLGRKRLMVLAVTGFTIASALCGIATNIGELVTFRLLQGAMGATLVPLGQAVLLDIYPKEQHGQAMATWSMGVVLGPVIGPVLGGWLTDSLSWRWVFFINLPIGVLSVIGLSASMTGSRDAKRPQIDFMGFAMLSLAIGSLQLVLDRGQTKDWFGSLEVCIEAGATLLFGYMAAVHTVTARRSFINLSLFSDRNFVVGSLLGFFIGPVLFGVLALLPTMLEDLLGYPVTTAGLAMAPRGLGTFIAMTMMGKLLKRIDARILISGGFIMIGAAMYRMSGFSLGMDQRLIMTSGFVQGLGIGMVYVSLTTVAFATLDSRYRNDGTAMFSLIRNIGSSVGISILQVMTVRNAAIVHARLAESIGPDNPNLAYSLPDFDFNLPASVAQLNAEITRQAGMVSYIDAFWALFIMAIAVTPLLILIQPPGKAATPVPGSRGTDSSKSEA